jgi:Tol biopolymer transport system component
MIIALVAAVIVTAAPGQSQKAKKPPQPPAPAADPAIAYIANIYKGASMAKTMGQLMVMNADGSNQRVVISETGFEYGAPDWSPDGTQLVFSRYNIPARDTGIYVVNVDGTGLREVFNCGEGGGLEGPVRWSPMVLADGLHKIAFCYSVRRPDGTYEIDQDAFLVNLDGSGLARLTNTQGVGEGNISWSPTADRITFPACCDPETGNGGFVVCRINYDPVTALFSLTPELTCFEFGWGFWANHQDTLALGHNNDIWLCDISTNYPFLFNQVTFTPTAGELIMSWSPDDSKILFVQLGGFGGGLYVINSDGSGGLVQISSENFTWRAPRWRRNL